MNADSMLSIFVVTGIGIARVRKREDALRATNVLEDESVQCVAVDPKNSSVVYVGTRGKGVLRSTDRGETWRDLKLPEADVFSLAVSPASGAVYAGTEPSKLFMSTDRGKTWREREGLQEIPSRPEWSFPPRPETSHVRWIAPSPHDADLLLVGIELGGLMRSTDGGRTWTDHRPGAQKDVHCLAWHPRVEGRAYEAGGGGAAWSTDGGMTWEAADDGRDRHYTWGLAVAPEDSNTWFVSASPGPREAHSEGRAEAFIYRWQGAGPWEALGGSLPEPLGSFPYALLAAGGQLFAGLGDGRLYASSDRGDTWRKLQVEGASLAGLRALAAADRT